MLVLLYFLVILEVKDITLIGGHVWRLRWNIFTVGWLLVVVRLLNRGLPWPSLCWLRLVFIFVIAEIKLVTTNVSPYIFLGVLLILIMLLCLGCSIINIGILLSLLLAPHKLRTEVA